VEHDGLLGAELLHLLWQEKRPALEAYALAFRARSPTVEWGSDGRGHGSRWDRREPELIRYLPRICKILRRENNASRKALQHRLGVMDAVHLAQLRRGLDDEHHAHVVAGEITDGFRDDGNTPEGCELIEQHHHLVLECRIALRELPGLEPDRL